MDVNRVRLLVVVFLAAVLPARAQAQSVARTFDELRMLVGSGDTVFVTEQTGPERRARVLEITGSSLAVLVDGGRRDLEEGGVMRIRMRGGDPLWNGAVIGAVTGVGIVVAIGAALDGFDDCSAQCVALDGGIYGGLGALVGVGIDALIKGRGRSPGSCRAGLVRNRTMTARIRTPPQVRARRI